VLNQPQTHSDAPAGQASSRLALALVLTAFFVGLEAGAGLFARSLALLTDAAHNLTDVIALGLSWYALRLATQPSDARNTYGYHRAGILVALINSTTLVLISLGVFYEAYHRLRQPVPVNSGILIGVGSIALVVNLVTALMVRGGSEHDLNMRSSFLHLAGDAASSLGAVAAGVIIYFTSMNWLDPLASILIGVLILRNAWLIVRETADILLESTPRDVDVGAMVSDIMQIQGVRGIHDLHVWSISRGLRTLSAHILTDDIPISAGAIIHTRLNELLARRYSIAHATLQLECAGCEPDVLFCDIDGVIHGQGRA
jgi:cobalt-zinc-cadmium efflux system protein